MKKNHEVRIKLSQEELNKIKLKAREIGLTISSYMRLISLAAKTPI